MLKFSRSLYVCNHLSESIHTWSIGTPVILKTVLWPVQTDLEIFRPIYFASNVILSVRKNVHSGHICNEICRNDNGCGVFFMIGPNIHTF